MSDWKVHVGTGEPLAGPEQWSCKPELRFTKVTLDPEDWRELVAGRGKMLRSCCNHPGHMFSGLNSPVAVRRKAAGGQSKRMRNGRTQD